MVIITCGTVISVDTYCHGWQILLSTANFARLDDTQCQCQSHFDIVSFV